MQAGQQQVNPLVSSSGAPGWSSVCTASPGLPHALRAWGLQPAEAARGPISEQLAQSLSWLDAVALAQVLKAAPAAPAAPATPAPPEQPEQPGQAERLQAARAWARAALERLQSELLAGFADPVLVREGPTPALRRAAPRVSVPKQAPRQAAKPAGALEALAPFRLHHSSQQRSMALRVTGLRERLRGQLAGLGPRLARLAALDAVFERALQAREQQALGALPSMTVQRGLSLHAAEAAAEPEDPGLWPAPGWRGQLWDELQRVLRAELALRLQPVLGLIQALEHDDPTPTAPAP